MTTIATVLKTRLDAIAAAQALTDAKERLWEKHYGDLSPDDDGEYPERDAAYQAQVAATDLAGLQAAQDAAEREMVEAYLNATDHPRLIATKIPALRDGAKRDGAIWWKLRTLILETTPRALRGGR